MEFPPKPKLVNTSITKPSKAFIKETYKVCISILFFILVYLFLFTLALGLALGAGYLGYLIVIFHPGLVTLMVGAALCLFGVFIIFFLVKFVTTKNEHDTSHLHEIKKSEEPELFEFIEKVVNEVGSDFPKKIFLSNEVNAYVFYDSNFWSLFFPVKKNLNIGLGLINSINLSEFKAILAHEFGHFSQKSMKLGSYIYYVNRVIHNMLYENDSYEKSISKISESNGYLALAGTLTFLVIRFFQLILRLVYTPINTMYLSLSRQMEFHADAISASVTGGNHLTSSLQRLEMSGVCFNTLMSSYEQWGFDHYKAKNIYKNHKEVQKHFAEDHELGFENNIIGIAKEKDFTRQARVKVNDQWASHPSLEQRTEYLNSLNLYTEAIDSSPWKLFKNAKSIQENHTEHLFENLSTSPTAKPLSNLDFVDKYFEEFNKVSLPKEYYGFFNNYFPIDIELEENNNGFNELPLDQVLNQKEIYQLQDSSAIYTDLNLLQHIIDGSSDIKSFDFDGKKYKSKKAKEIYAIVENDSNQLTERYKSTANKIIQYFYSEARKKGVADQYKSNYQNLVSELIQYSEDYEVYDQIGKEISPIFQGNIPFKVAEEINDKVQEIELKFKEILVNKISLNQLKDVDFSQYLERTRNYFSIDSFNDKNLEILFSALSKFIESQDSRLARIKKDFLEYQLTLSS